MCSLTGWDRFCSTCCWGGGPHLPEHPPASAAASTVSPSDTDDNSSNCCIGVIQVDVQDLAMWLALGWGVTAGCYKGLRCHRFWAGALVVQSTSAWCRDAAALGRCWEWVEQAPLVQLALAWEAGLGIPGPLPSAAALGWASSTMGCFISPSRSSWSIMSSYMYHPPQL